MIDNIGHGWYMGQAVNNSRCILPLMIFSPCLMAEKHLWEIDWTVQAMTDVLIGFYAQELDMSANDMQEHVLMKSDCTTI